MGLDTTRTGQILHKPGWTWHRMARFWPGAFIPSFVVTYIGSGIVSPRSRMYQRKQQMPLMMPSSLLLLQTQYVHGGQYGGSARP